MKLAFDNDAYLKNQSKHINDRISQYDKLYLEFGGKLFDDYHASRVLPGFRPDSKLQMLLELSDKVEIIIVINAADIAKNKIRSDLGITYDNDVLRLMDAFHEAELYVGGVVMTRYANQSSANDFKRRLEHLGIRVVLNYSIEGYPSNVDYIVSDEGLGKNEFLETTKPLVVVTAPGPGSGKMATCLSQLYHENKRGVKAGYAKFETFPVWNLPLDHEVNIAYEAATADLNDINMIDPYHLQAYNKLAINYNRDVEIFPVLAAMFKKINGDCPYKSPTDMGVNMVGYCIIDDQAAKEASKREIIRRYYKALVDLRNSKYGSQEALNKIQLLMQQTNIKIDEFELANKALDKAKETKEPAVSIELPDGRIITGKTSKLMGASAACVLNTLKVLGKINDEYLLISPSIIAPVQDLKINTLGNNNPRLHLDEVLIALSISATNNPISHLALQQLSKLENVDAHSTVILSDGDLNTFRNLKIRLTCEPIYRKKRLYHK